jgi:hypothetical protein
MANVPLIPISDVQEESAPTSGMSVLATVSRSVVHWLTELAAHLVQLPTPFSRGEGNSPDKTTEKA